MIGEKVIGDYKRLYEVDLCKVLVLANNCNFHSFFTGSVKILGRFTIVTWLSYLWYLWDSNNETVKFVILTKTLLCLKMEVDGNYPGYYLRSMVRAGQTHRNHHIHLLVSSPTQIRLKLWRQIWETMETSKRNCEEL